MDKNVSNWIKMAQTWINWIYHYLCRLPLEDEEATANSLEPGLERLLWLKKPESVIAELVLGRLVGLWLLLLLVLLELVKEWVPKSQPSFCQILHIFPILNKITQFFSYCNRKIGSEKNAMRSNLYYYSSLPLWIMSKLKTKKCVKFLSFGKIPIDHLWGSANENIVLDS